MSKNRLLKITIIVVLVLFVFFGIILANDLFNNNGTNGISPFKNSEDLLERDIFDEYVAYGEVHSLKEILNSNLISQEDKEILVEYKKEIKTSLNKVLFLGSDDTNFVIDFGLKEENSVIRFKHLSSPGKEFVFKSTLDYEFSYIIQSFEEECKEILTSEFLNSSVQINDNIFESEIMFTECSGIVVKFQKNKDKYTPYYKMFYKGKVYISN